MPGRLNAAAKLPAQFPEVATFREVVKRTEAETLETKARIAEKANAVIADSVRDIAPAPNSSIVPSSRESRPSVTPSR
jgi:hypothetical protein